MVSDRSTSLSSTPQSGSEIGWVQMINLISDTLGIQIQPQQQAIFEKNVWVRLKKLSLSSLTDYYQYLVADQRPHRSEEEWQGLIPLLTVTESYFLRDKGQFELLRNQILPDLIEQKRQLHSRQPNDRKLTLRLWSAGCSTGEEVYSLAMLIKESIPDYQAWDILILGTDINQPAIEQARQGIYSDWSLRATESDVKNRYFHIHQKGWKVDRQIQNMVTFRFKNLVQDKYPDYASEIYEFDLILCRNVFIYFDCKTIAKVVKKFYDSLAIGGFLLTGHTELYKQDVRPFQVKSFPQSVIYQKGKSQSSQSVASGLDTSKSPSLQTNSVHKRSEGNSPTDLGDNSNTNSPSPIKLEAFNSISLISLSQQQKSHEQKTRSGATTQEALLNEAQHLLAQELYKETIQITKKLIGLTSNHFQAYCLSAEAHANLGQYLQANQDCQQAIQINPLAIEPYYLLAQIAEEQGDIEGAKLSLKRITYLAPNSVSAYLELGTIYKREGNTKQAKRTWQSLLEVLQNLPQEQVVISNGQQTVAELKSYVLKNLETET